MHAEPVSLSEAADFLASHHGSTIASLEPLRGGYWSTAFAYEADGQELVVRFGTQRQGFEMDRAARSFGRHHLPIPEVFEIGDAFDGSFAISARHRGRFLEETTVGDAGATAEALLLLLAALRAAGETAEAASQWYPPGTEPTSSTWQGWLLAGIADEPSRVVSGWRQLLAEDADAHRLFRRLEARVLELVPGCPERRDLVHGDLLHQNVLVAGTPARMSAVFSWKCSVLGDFLFDVALCTFWGPWHPGVEAMDVWRATLADPSLAPIDVVDAAARHHCYELHLGATHMGWSMWTGDRQAFRAVCERAAFVLERGPLRA